MKRFIIILIVLVLSYSCKKDNEDTGPQYEFNKHILNGYFVKSIAFDKQGNAWIGTFEQGLIKYNQNETIVYNSSNSIISDTSVIYDIAVDNKNNVWIGCEGLIKFDGTDFTVFNSLNTPMPEDFVISIAIDSKDNIWFTSCRFKQGGIVKYDGLDWNVYTPDNSNLPVHFVNCIAIDQNDNVWLSLNEYVNDAYLVKISEPSWTIYTSDDLGFVPYYFGNIRINNKNQLCGAIDYSFSSTLMYDQPQIFIFDGTGSEQLHLDINSTVKFITIDNEDNIWCGTYQGYAVYNGQGWTVYDSGFINEGIFAIEQSPDGKIWIGTGDGIYISD